MVVTSVPRAALVVLYGVLYGVMGVCGVVMALAALRGFYASAVVFLGGAAVANHLAERTERTEGTGG